MLMSRLILFRLPSSVRSAGKEVFQRLTDLRKIVSLICTGQHHTLLFSRKSAVLECMIPKLVLGNLCLGIDSLQVSLRNLDRCQIHRHWLQTTALKHCFLIKGLVCSRHLLETSSLEPPILQFRQQFRRAISPCQQCRVQLFDEN